MFEALPEYAAQGGIAEDPEWKKFHPIVLPESYADKERKPDTKLPEYQIGTDVQSFLRRWRVVVEEHIKCGVIRSHVRLFDKLALSLLACDWSDTYIPACNQHVPVLLSQLLTFYGGESASLTAWNALQCLAPGQEVPEVMKAFELHAPKVLQSEASPSKLAELFVSKLPTEYTFSLTAQGFGNYLEAGQRALTVYNAIRRGAQLSVAAHAPTVVPPQTPPLPLAQPPYLPPGQSPPQHVVHPPPPTYGGGEPMDWEARLERLEGQVARGGRLGGAGGGGTGGGRGGRGASCYNCGLPGHMARDCRRTPPAPTFSGTLCYNCGRPGHFARDCRAPPRNSSGGGRNRY